MIGGDGRSLCDLPQRPIRAVGKRLSFSEEYPDCVSFVCAKDVDGHLEPRGTGFFVSVPSTTTKGRHAYAVTAKHVVADGKPTWLRYRRYDGGTPDDVPLKDGWVLHPTADVAVAPVVVDLEHRALAVPEDQFVDRWHRTAVLSDEINFVGLLKHVPTMLDRAIPMVRGGILGATYQEGVPLWDELHKVTITEPSAHLIDSHSVSGFSGSPVFVGQQQLIPNADLADKSLSGGVGLLGVLIGHFGGPLSSDGVAVVVPVEVIRAFLDNSAGLVRERERKEGDFAARETRVRDASAAVQDTASPNPEWDSFEDLTRDLVNTPKPEVDEAPE